MVLNTHTYENSRVDSRKIWLPRLSRPAAVQPGGEFIIQLSDCGGRELSLKLADEEQTRQLPLQQ